VFYNNGNDNYCNFHTRHTKTVCDQPTSKVREERGRERRGVERGKGKTEEGRG